MRILVTGATGYVGGRLVPRLLERGHTVRVLVRDPSRLQGRPWLSQVEVVQGSLEASPSQHPDHASSLDRALEGVDVAYYLVHAMLAGGDFPQLESGQAETFAQSAHRAGVGRVIYLGGLQPKGVPPSPHLASRAKVGETLRAWVPTTEFRAGPIIGSGSASFEMVRYLTERLPIMVAPRWVLNLVSPIAIRDVLSYLLLALDREPLGVVEIGSAPLTFRAMMETYAAVRGLKRLILPLPVLAPHLAALWVGLVTPIPNRLALPLVEGILHPLVADTRRAQELFPQIAPIPYRTAVELALERIALGEVETRWSGALLAGPSYALEDREGIIREVRRVPVAAPPRPCFAASPPWAGSRAGACGTGPGRCGACWTGSWEAPGCAGGAATPANCSPGRRWISGGWRRCVLSNCCACGRRCAFLGGPGWSGGRCPRKGAAPWCRPPTSSPRG